jgi:hypothetical protein
MWTDLSSQATGTVIDAGQVVQAFHRLVSAAQATIAGAHIGSIRQVVESVFDRAMPGARPQADREAAAR